MGDAQDLSSSTVEVFPPENCLNNSEEQNGTITLIVKERRSVPDDINKPFSYAELISLFWRLNQIASRKGKIMRDNHTYFNFETH